MRRPLIFLISFAVLGLACMGILPAQQASVTGPVEGIMFDAPTRSLRAVIGSPGAATFGAALLDNLDVASVAPGQNYGIIYQSGNWLLVSSLNSKSMSSVAIPGVAAYPDGIVWSADGSLAILYSSVGSWFQTISGFPSAPVAAPAVDVSALGGSLAAIAVDTAGKQIAFGIGGDNGAVYQAGSGAAFTPLVSMAKPLALSFSNDGGTLYALDGATLNVTAVSLGGHGIETLALPGIANPVAIQAVQDSQSRQLLYVAGGSDRILRVLDLASRQVVTDVPLNFEPTGIDRFGSGSFVVAPRTVSTKPLWLFTSTPLLSAYFVPAIQLHQPDHVREVVRRTP